MSSPYLGEVKIFSFNFPPRGWAFCNGQLMSIQQNQALFAVIGTTYGGNGVNNFQLPNLQGRLPYHAGNGYVQGQVGGAEFHTLLTTEMPTHNHAVNASSAAASDQGAPTNNLWVAQTGNSYSSSGGAAMAGAAITQAGGGQPHENRPPYLVLNFCIALSGIFPSRN
jgi:microcystin-dependent protein